MLHRLSGEGHKCVEILHVPNRLLRIVTQVVDSSVVKLYIFQDVIKYGRVNFTVLDETPCSLLGRFRRNLLVLFTYIYIYIYIYIYVS